jgi:hypothetical protein
MRKSTFGFFVLKSLPQWLGRVLVSTGLVHLFTDYFKMAKRTLTEVLDELTDNRDLKTVLAYSFGDYGKYMFWVNKFLNFCLTILSHNFVSQFCLIYFFLIQLFFS